MDDLQCTEWSNFLSLNIINECLYFSPVVANGGQPSSSQGSDSYSSTSSLSSGTPVSSLSGLSQVMFPPLFGSDLVDVCISTENCSERIETAMQTDPQEPDATSRSSRVLSTETSRTVGETVLLKDTVIRSGTAKTRTRTFSAGDKETLDSPKTAVLMALSKPRKTIRRSQSHITVSGTVGLVWRDKKPSVRLWIKMSWAAQGRPVFDVTRISVVVPGPKVTTRSVMRILGYLIHTPRCESSAQNRKCVVENQQWTFRVTLLRLFVKYIAVCCHCISAFKWTRLNA